MYSIIIVTRKQSIKLIFYIKHNYQVLYILHKCMKKIQTNKFLIKTILFNLITFKFIYTKSYYYFNIYLNNNYFIQAIKNTFICKCIMTSYITCLRFEQKL